jgi:hypothetical protein
MHCFAFFAGTMILRSQFSFLRISILSSFGSSSFGWFLVSSYPSQLYQFGLTPDLLQQLQECFLKQVGDDVSAIPSIMGIKVRLKMHFESFPLLFMQ